jgi:hypothetical protein
LFGALMKVLFLAIVFSVCSFQLLAQTPSESSESFCSDRKDPNFVKTLTYDPENLMYFDNYGGLANGGVCWWHSRFQRNALYLTIFKPSLEKPTRDEAIDLIKQIREGSEVVVITGFKNLKEFSYETQDLIQEELERWQKHDGITRFAWFKGLTGSSKKNVKRLKKMMDQIYEDVEIKKNISYNKLQMPGVKAHSWLVIHMKKVKNGYDLLILDSNVNSKLGIYKYREGDTYFEYFTEEENKRFSPYLDQTNEMEKINRVIAKRCNPAE